MMLVDDFILLHESPQWLNAALADIAAFLPRALHARLNPAKTILQPVDRGVDFVGHLIKPWCSRTRRRTLRQTVSRIATLDSADVYTAANSYFGLLRQSPNSHADRAHLAKATLKRGHAVNSKLTKAYRTNHFSANYPASQNDSFLIRAESSLKVRVIRLPRQK